MPDHVHLLLSIPPKHSVSSFMGYLKRKNALMMFDKHANLKYKYGNRYFWAEGYYVSTVGLLYIFVLLLQKIPPTCVNGIFGTFELNDTNKICLKTEIFLYCYSNLSIQGN